MSKYGLCLVLFWSLGHCHWLKPHLYFHLQHVPGKLLHLADFPLRWLNPIYDNQFPCETSYHRNWNFIISTKHKRRIFQNQNNSCINRIYFNYNISLVLNFRHIWNSNHIILSGLRFFWKRIRINLQTRNLYWLNGRFIDRRWIIL